MKFDVCQSPRHDAVCSGKGEPALDLQSNKCLIRLRLYVDRSILLAMRKRCRSVFAVDNGQREELLVSSVAAVDTVSRLPTTIALL